ncbi:carbohydrate ABC transporter permease [Nocardiopsis flavescens]|uniref:Raffinose/stachyose/melibiose transport system permease protein n=1 Tax=Nocardiopsis flavescens TaxID=758803 RepID=A0A1M6US22_9ACTN|nr:carbohydrate ABC transporter permease [Nocardiopsis flavescens]SHK71954.1 raffinose/stachyose/melibiose transport system permease protein [Nocardiopsis flavescens]
MTTTARRSRRPRRLGSPNRGGPLVYLLLILLAVYAAAPIVVLFFSALKTPAELSTNPMGLPADAAWENFLTAWNNAGMATGLRNSAVIVTATAVGVCLISGAAAYAMVRLDVPAPGAITMYLLVVTALPLQLFLVPLVSWWTKTGLYDTQFGLVLIYWAIYSPFSTLLLRSYLIAIPPDYEAAARIDGAGELTVFFRIVLPLIWPGVLTAGLIAALQAYNEFLLAVTFIQDSEALPVSISLYSFQQGFTVNHALVAAAGLIMALPVLALFLVLQRRFVEGYASTGLAN